MFKAIESAKFQKENQNKNTKRENRKKQAQRRCFVPHKLKFFKFINCWFSSVKTLNNLVGELLPILKKYNCLIVSILSDEKVYYNRSYVKFNLPVLWLFIGVL